MPTDNAIEDFQDTVGPYRYSPLQSKHIRLLQATLSDNEIFCKLWEFPIEECPGYHALSYAWGSDSPTRRIFFDGHKAQLITEQLYQGLKSVFALLAPSWLWLDQISINQNDLEEKAVQVALMGEIYAGAIQTIVWLGPDYQKSDLAMEHAEGIAELITNYDFNPTLAIQAPVELGFPHEDEQVWPAFQLIFKRPWWTRLWIIQEAIKAQDIVFIVGSRSASYDDFLTLASAHEKLLNSIPNGTHKLGILTGLSKAFFALRSDVLCLIDGFRSGRYAITDGESNNNNNNLIQIIGNTLAVLEFSSNQACKEPVDRIYAILGLVSEQLKKEIKIDYSDENKREYWRTHIDFYRHVIRLFASGGYMFTTVATGRHTSLTPRHLPSWCPDLVNSGKNHAIPIGMGAGVIPSSSSWQPDYTMIEPCNSNPSILHVTGVQIDSIQKLIPLWSAPRPVLFDKFTCSDATNVKIPLKSCFELAETMRKSPEDFEWMDVLFRTLVMNTRGNSVERYPATTLGTDCLAFLNRLTAIIEHHHNGKELDAGSVSEEATRYASAFFEMTRGRAVFMTKGGKLGMCDARAEVGDEVAVWFNCMYPVVQRVVPGIGGCELVGGPQNNNSTTTATAAATSTTRIPDAAYTKTRIWLPGKFAGERRQQNHRKLLGLCYVDGLMDGEIFKERDIGKEGYSNFLIV